MHMIWHMYFPIRIEGVRVLKSPKGKWGELFNLEGDDEGFEESLGLEKAEGDGVLFLEEAHEALNKLSQKTNKRGKLMKQPRRAESWQ
jgi:hypothetical protein